MIFTLCYDLVLILGSVLSLPKWLFDMAIHKKYRSSFLDRFAHTIPKLDQSKKPVIWIHMVSVGETKAMISLYEKLKSNYPNASIYLSSTTETGHKESKQSLLGATHYFYLPFDFSWAMKSLTEKIRPDFLILSEGDFWYNMLKSVKEQGGKVFLVNGKISSKSTKRFQQVPWFAKKLFEHLDLLCLQNASYVQRFSGFSIPQNKLHITGNLKLSSQAQKIEKEHWKTRLCLTTDHRVITIGSTHEGEERLLLKELKPLFEKYPQLKILLAPRHPERFKPVFDELKDDYPISLLSEDNQKPILLINEMGILPICYQFAEVSIVGGSFVRGVGGHNIFEPIQANSPVIFGPHMDNQFELAELILSANAGLQKPVSELAETISELLENPEQLKKNVSTLRQKVHGSINQTWQILEPHFKLVHNQETC